MDFLETGAFLILLSSMLFTPFFRVELQEAF
jgi:hypothetical protein